MTQNKKINRETPKNKKKNDENSEFPGLSGILVPKCRDLLSRGILVAAQIFVPVPTVPWL